MNFFKNVHIQTNLPSTKRENMINNMNLSILPRPNILKQTKNLEQSEENKVEVEELYNVKSIDIFTSKYVINIANSLSKIIKDCGIVCNVYLRKLNNSDIDKCINDKEHYLFIICPHQFLQSQNGPIYPNGLKQLPINKYFLYQLEQLDSNELKFWNDNIKNLIKNSKHTFDYSEINLDYYPQDIKNKVSLMTPPVVEFKDEYFVEWENKTIDVLFCGYMNERREKIIKSLKNEGINVTVCTDIFGEELTKKIAQAKVYLNISTGNSKILETCRLNEAVMSKNTHIISEKSDNFDSSEYNERITFIDKIENNICKKLIDNINKDSNNNYTKYTFIDIITKDVKNILNIYIFYPYLFHKYVLGIRNINDNHNYNITEIKKGILIRKNICHIHCFDLNKFEFMFGVYISSLLKYFDIIVTYCIDNNNNIINNMNYSYITFIKVNNYGMDIGPKFSVYNYLKTNNIDYNYIFYIHSSYEKKNIDIFLSSFINNIDYIDAGLNSKYPICFFNNSLDYNDIMINNKCDNLYMKNIFNYLKLEYNEHELFMEQTFYIIQKKIIDLIFSDTLLYNIFTDIDNSSNYININNNVEKNIQFCENIKKTNFKIKNIFKYLPINLCKKYNIKYNILFTNSQSFEYKNNIEKYIEYLIEYDIYQGINNIEKLINKNYITMDISIPIYFKNNTDLKYLHMIKIFKYLNKIRNILNKYNILITFTIIGSNKNLSEELFNTYLKLYEDDIYIEFDQNNIDYNKNIYINYNNCFFDMLSRKFSTCFINSFKKNKDISFLMGSNDFISINFFLQTKYNYEKNKKQCYGINRPINNTYNYELLIECHKDITKNLLLDIKNIWNLDYGNTINSKPLFAGGIIGFSNKLFTDKHFYNYFENPKMYHLYNEILLERYAIQHNAELPTVNNILFLNIKTSCDITQISSIINNNIINQINNDNIKKNSILYKFIKNSIFIYNNI